MYLHAIPLVGFLCISFLNSFKGRLLRQRFCQATVLYGLWSHCASHALKPASMLKDVIAGSYKTSLFLVHSVNEPLWRIIGEFAQYVICGLFWPKLFILVAFPCFARLLL